MDLEDSAPAENFILDERVPDARENDYLGFSTFCTSPLDRDSWFRHHVSYCRDRVALPTTSATFSTINQPNWLGLSPDWDVVRVETLCGLADRAIRRGSDVSEAEADKLIREMLLAREAGVTFDVIGHARLSKWIGQVNSGSDRRPAFVAPFAEVEAMLKQPDWANRLRDALGLGHIRSLAGRPTTLVLMQYNLIRVHNAYIGKSAWAASPTVLDDVPGQMPNPCFFPAPKKASADGYGYTVDLATTGASYHKEFLHGHIVLTLEDIRSVGEVTTDLAPSRIADARKAHRELLENDLAHLADIPARV